MTSAHDLTPYTDQPVPFPRSPSEAERGDKKSNDEDSDCFQIESRIAYIIWGCIGIIIGVPLTIYVIYYVVTHTLNWKENLDAREPNYTSHVKITNRDYYYE